MLPQRIKFVLFCLLSFSENDNFGHMPFNISRGNYAVSKNVRESYCSLTISFPPNTPFYGITFNTFKVLFQIFSWCM